MQRERIVASDASVSRTRIIGWFVFLALLVVALGAAPWVGVDISFLFYLALWITMASGLNIIAGFTGYVPFGYVAFYGIGAFAMAVMTRKLGLPIALSLPLAGVVGVALSLVFARTLRLQGLYFAIVSLALANVCQLVISNLPAAVTGGSFGISLGTPSNATLSYYVMLGFMVAALLTASWLAQSRLGVALKAIRDDAEAADVLGVNVPRARLAAWMLSALFAALAGATEAWYTNIVDPTTAFEIVVTAKTIIYATMGGLGTVTGPVIGTGIMVWLDNLIWQRFPLLDLFLLGLVVILLVLFLPRGIVGTLLQRHPRLRRYIL